VHDNTAKNKLQTEWRTAELGLQIFSCECSEIIRLVNNNIALTTTQSICTNKSLSKNKSNTKENGLNISLQF